uniref:Uncharacterized protein n=1 Tax=Wuchereria bancrofti TaxID=6293 RepID=A0A1I8EJ30_WUCBA
MKFKNNLNDSCLLEENEIQYYRRHLSNNRFYQELLIDRDHVIRSYISRHNVSQPMLLGFGLAFEFEDHIKASILQCVRQSHRDHLYRERQQPQRQWYEQQNEHFNKPILSTGKKDH